MPEKKKKKKQKGAPGQVIVESSETFRAGALSWFRGQSLWCILFFTRLLVESEHLFRCCWSGEGSGRVEAGAFFLLLFNEGEGRASEVALGCHAVAKGFFQFGEGNNAGLFEED